MENLVNMNWNDISNIWILYWVKHLQLLKSYLDYSNHLLFIKHGGSEGERIFYQFLINWQFLMLSASSLCGWREVRIQRKEISRRILTIVSSNSSGISIITLEIQQASCEELFEAFLLENALKFFLMKSIGHAIRKTFPGLKSSRYSFEDFAFKCI